MDSRDIVELELKHKNYEIVIKKKEAVAPPPAPVVQASWPQFSAPVSAPPPPQPAAAAAPVAPSPPPSAPPPAAAAEAAAPSGLPMKSPMAGTFYRSPAPGEPSFVKVGDRVQKGQVICIVEAMKLMNEIEVNFFVQLLLTGLILCISLSYLSFQADQSGVITEILANDGSGVAVDTVRFIWCLFLSLLQIHLFLFCSTQPLFLIAP